ncbi:MAG: InlB B-repeat-containing protein, partial [Candidatus Pelethousia sp.]|nr:InlB B-repeat-containing protein [Candidatus Pelethousia sp.]
MYGTGRKVFSLLLALVLVFTLVPASVFAEDDGGGSPTGEDNPPIPKVEMNTDITEQEPKATDTQIPPEEPALNELDLIQMSPTGHKDKCTVTFKSDGKTVESRTVDKGATVSEPPAPTKEGFTFKGWYTENNTLWNFAGSVNRDITLYAKWDAIPIIFTVNFISNGGSEVPSQSVRKDERAEKPTPNPTREGYSFKGWYEDERLTNEWNFNKKVKEDITLYAKWELIPAYTVTFNSNGGSPIASQSVPGGSTVTRPENPTLEGHTFEGWYRNQNLTGKWDFVNDTV